MPMRVALEFQSEQLDFEVAEDRLIAAWQGPEPIDPAQIVPLVREALESPRGYPPLRQAVVPDDQVVLAVDPDLSEAPAIVSATCAVLNEAGVENRTIQVLLTASPPAGWTDRLPEGLAWKVHDPRDDSGLAYLASSAEGRRIYLNRLATDADFVLSIGPIGFDARLGARGPWSVIFPGLSDAETHRSFRPRIRRDAGEGPAPLDESVRVSWLLGSQLQIGVLPGRSGLAEIMAGSEEVVQKEGIHALAESWTLRVSSRADLVVIGIGQPGRSAGFEELARALATASRLVEPGGKIAVLSRIVGKPGPAVHRLLGVEEPRERLQTLKGAEDEPDFLAARRLARALNRANLYLFSDLPEDLVDDLAMVPLEQPTEARRLADTATSCLFVSHAELTRAQVDED